MPPVACVLYRSAITVLVSFPEDLVVDIFKSALSSCVAGPHKALERRLFTMQVRHKQAFLETLKLLCLFHGMVL